MKPLGWLASAAVHGLALLALGSVLVQPAKPDPRRAPPPLITAWLLPAPEAVRTVTPPTPPVPTPPRQPEPRPTPPKPAPTEVAKAPVPVAAPAATVAVATPAPADHGLATPAPATATAAPPSPPVQLAAAATAPPPRPETPPAEQPASLPADHRQCSERQTARLYPAMLRERGVQGQVLLRVRVDENGRATDVQVQGGSGFRLLDEAARLVAQSCPYLPARRGDQRLASWVEYPVRFALQPSSLQ